MEAHATTSIDDEDEMEFLARTKFTLLWLLVLLQFKEILGLNRVKCGDE